MKFGSLIDFKLFNNKSCESIIAPLMKRNVRKRFGILETPTHISDCYDGVVSYKIFVCGKSSSGKTSLISKLCGKDQVESSSETLGIETSVLYWPVRIIETKKTIMFKITFWDVGEANLNAYSYLLPSCLEEVDCVLYLFSLKSKGSWDSLPSLITKVNTGEDVLEACIGTHFDSSSSSEICLKMMKDFEDSWKFPVLTIRNIGSRQIKFKQPYEAFNDVAPLLNRLCELLWYNDQIKAGLVQRTLADFCFVDENREADLVTKEDIEKHSKLITFC